jgi:site-specific recombinase XerD
MVERQNYLLISRFLKYLLEVKHVSKKSVARYEYDLRHLLLWADDRLFSNLESLRPTFPDYLSGLGNNGVNLASGTQKKALNSAKRFFKWARSNTKELSKIHLEWFEALQLPKQVKNSSEHVHVTLEEVQNLIECPVPENDLALIRDKAAVAFLFLSGIRAGAFVTLPIRAIDLDQLTVKQLTELGVQTKNSKSAITYLYEIPDLLNVIRKWDSIVRAELPDDALWYAPINHSWGEQSLSKNPPGKNRVQALGKRFRKLYSLVGLEYKSPHKFRHGHAVYGLLNSKDMADYKAVSTNLMHSNLKTTDEIYAPLAKSEVKNRITNLPSQSKVESTGEIEKMLMNLNKNELRNVINYGIDVLAGSP